MNTSGRDLTAAIRVSCLAFTQAIELGLDDATAFRAAVAQYRLMRPDAPEREARAMMSLGLSWPMIRHLP